MLNLEAQPCVFQHMPSGAVPLKPKREHSGQNVLLTLQNNHAKPTQNASQTTTSNQKSNGSKSK
jgi:hypothetical protein